MGNELFAAVGTCPCDPHVRDALGDAGDAERPTDNLVRLRERRGLSQFEVAERMETTQSSGAEFDRAGGDPELSMLRRYARAVGARLHCTVAARPGGEVWCERQYQVPQRAAEHIAELKLRGVLAPLSGTRGRTD